MERTENTSKRLWRKDGLSPLEINKHEDSGLVDIWLSREDQADPAMLAKARELSRQFAAEKWTAAVFFSGRQDLAEETSALLQYNRRRSAERTVQQRKARKQGERR